MLVGMNPQDDTRLLVDANEIPVLGLGVWQVPGGPECVNAVRWALEAGYRHIDTAQAYHNEESVGRALRESGVPREQVFITTKFLPRRRDPVAQLEMSLRRLGVEQIDLYLVHWPEGSATRAWSGLERARELGLARSIGVSNFSAAELETVIAAGAILPVVNQVEVNPQHYRRGLLDVCARHSVAVEAYSPLGTGRSLADPAVGRIAEQAGRVRLRYCCAGAFSAISSLSPSPCTGPASRRTRRSSILPCHLKPWPNSTHSIGPAAPAAHRNTSGSSS